MRKIGNLVLICLALFTIISFAAPVLATNPPDTGTISADQKFEIQYYDIESDAALHFFDSVKFNHIENFNHLNQITATSYDFGTKTNLNNYYSNVSSQTVYFFERGKSSAFANLIGYGKMWYSIDNNNVIHLIVDVQNWNIGILNGTHIIDIRPSAVSNAGETIRFTSSPGFCLERLKTYTTGPGASLQNYTTWYDSVSDSYDSVQFRTTTFSQLSDVTYTRIPGTSQDTWNFQRLYNSNSNITLQFNSNNSWQTVLSEVGVVDIPNVLVQSGRNVKLSVANPITGYATDLYWIFTQEGILNIVLNKGMADNYPANPGDNITASGQYSGDISQVGKIVWNFVNEGTSTTAFTNDIREYTFYQTNNTWLYSDGIAYDFSNVIAQHAIYRYPNNDLNYTTSGGPYVILTLYDFTGNLITQTDRKVFVGSPLSSYTRYRINVPMSGGYSTYNNAHLWVFDDTSKKYLSSDELITTGSKLNTTTFGHSYIVWINDVNASLFGYNYNNVVGTDSSITHAKYANFTVSTYGTGTLNLYVNQLGTSNATVTFIITNLEGLPIPGATVHAAVGVSKQTDNTGTAIFTGLINGTYAQYSVLIDGYEQAFSQYQIYDGEVIALSLGLKTPMPTATIPTTPVPEGQFDIGKGITDLLAIYGISFSMFKLILAALIMGTFAGMMGKYVHGSEAVLVGAGIGFVLDIGLGLLDLWIAILAIIVFGLIYGRKFVQSSGG